MRAVFLCSVLLFACAPEPRPRVTCVTNGSPFTPVGAAPIGYPGQRFEVPLSWMPGTICSDGSGETVHSVVVELFDPDDGPMTATATAPVKRVDAQGTRWESTVAFEPTRLGPHHLIATFVPEGGLVQGDFYVVEDRRDAGFVEAYTAGTSCHRLEHTASGRLLCQTGVGAALFHDDGALPRFWPDAVGRPFGDVIWMTVPPNQLLRVRQLRDGGFQEDSLTASVTTSLAPINEDEAIIWSAEQHALRLIGFDAGYWTDLLGNFGVEPYRGAIAYSPDSGTAIIAAGNQWRRVDLRGNLAGMTTLALARTLHQAPAGIWFQTPAGTSLQFVPADPREPSRELTMPARWALPPEPGTLDLLRPGDGPILVPSRMTDAGLVTDTSQVLVPRLRDGGSEFLQYVAPQGATFQEISGPWLRASRGDNHFFFRLDPG